MESDTSVEGQFHLPRNGEEGSSYTLSSSGTTCCQLRHKITAAVLASLADNNSSQNLIFARGDSRTRSCL